MPAIHQKSLVWLLSTFSTSPSKTTIQTATDGNLGHAFTLSRVRKSLGLSPTTETTAKKAQQH
jgi:hypothetical protein